MTTALPPGILAASSAESSPAPADPRPHMSQKQSPSSLTPHSTTTHSLDRPRDALLPSRPLRWRRRGSLRSPERPRFPFMLPMTRVPSTWKVPGRQPGVRSAMTSQTRMRMNHAV